jgi:transketolase
MSRPDAIVRKLKRNIVEAAAKAGEGHIASAFSVLDLLWVLYEQILNVSPDRCDDDVRDRFILSKGHAALGLYAVMHEKGYWPGERLDEFGEFHSRFGGHPDRLSAALRRRPVLWDVVPVAVGVALGLKIGTIPAACLC